MIITEKFVLLAFPKTGTTFTTAVLRTIHARRRLFGRLCPQKWHKKLFKKLKLERPGLKEHLIPRPEPVPYHKQRWSRHGTYSDIPLADRDKAIISVVRDPFARYTSAYLFQTRMRKRFRAPVEESVLKDLYPNYPNISFEDFYDMMQRFETKNRLMGVEPKIDLGLQTINFIEFYFKNPVEVYQKIDTNYIKSGAYKKDMVDVEFLHQENLRTDFKGLLLRMGYSQEECDMADSYEQQNVAKRTKKENTPQDFYSPELKQKLLDRDALLFELFPLYRPE